MKLRKKHPKNWKQNLISIRKIRISNKSNTCFIKCPECARSNLYLSGIKQLNVIDIATGKYFFGVPKKKYKELYITQIFEIQCLDCCRHFEAGVSWHPYKTSL